MAINNPTVDLSGVPETMLWPLYNRACETRRPKGLLRDPLAASVAESIDYPFRRHFGEADRWHVLRALRFDAEIRAYLKRHPQACVVALGDGLETQFWRVDNGSLHWLSVDLPESISMRERFLPKHERLRNLACSALDLRWMDEVDPSRGVVVTAQGLLMYFEPAQVHELIARCAERFPGGIMLFDTVAKAFSARTLAGANMTADYVLPRMPWGVDADRIRDLERVSPMIRAAVELDPGTGGGLTRGRSFPWKRRLGLLGRDRAAFVRIDFAER